MKSKFLNVFMLLIAVISFIVPAKAFAAWPINIPGSIVLNYTETLMADIDSDGDLEAIFIPEKGPLYCVNADGTTAWTYDLAAPGYSLNFLPVTKTPVLADFDGDPSTLEIFIVFKRGMQQAPYTIENKALIISHSGSLLLDISGAFSNGQAITNPVVADITGDGNKEIYVGTNYGNQYAIHAIEIFRTPYLHYFSMWGTPITSAESPNSLAIANVTGTSTPELITTYFDSGNPSAVKVFDFSQQLLWSYITPLIHTAPVIADLDGDGQNEILVGTGATTYPAPGAGGKVICLNGAQNANPRVKWQFSGSEQGISKPPIVADLDRNGTKEIVVYPNSNRLGYPFILFVLDQSGQELWSATLTSSSYGAPVVTNFYPDHDGLEILVPDGNSIRVFNFMSQSLLFTYPAVPNEAISTPFSVASMDGNNSNGTMEFCYSTLNTTNYTGVYHCKTNIPGSAQEFSYSSQGVVRDLKPWLMRNQNLENNRMYQLPNNTPVLAPIGNRAVRVTRNLSFTVNATDPDADDIPILTATDLPTGATFADLGNGSGTFSWTPNRLQGNASYSLLFRATDPLGLYDQEIIVINVNGPQQTSQATQLCPATGC